MCSQKYRKMNTDFCTSYLVYSQIWLNQILLGMLLPLWLQTEIPKNKLWSA